MKCREWAFTIVALCLSFYVGISRALSIHGGVQIEGSIPPTVFVDVGLFNNNNKIIKSTSASTRLGYFEIFNVSSIDDGCALRISLNEADTLDMQRSVLSVPISIEPKSDAAVFVEGLRLVFKESKAKVVSIDAPTLPNAFLAHAGYNLPLIYQSTETGSVFGFVLTLVLLVALIAVKDKIFKMTGISLRPRKPQQVSVVSSRIR